MAADILPDSRLQNQSFGAVMIDWPLGDGSHVRTECIPVFCANCGQPRGYVPKDNTTWACWLCQNCAESYGEIAGTYLQPDDEFNRNVAAEMQDRFGRLLSAEEIAVVADQGALGRELELLMRESPHAA